MMLYPQSHALPNILHRDEQVRGVVYGRYSHTNQLETGRGMSRLHPLVATPFFHRVLAI